MGRPAVSPAMVLMLVLVGAAGCERQCRAGETLVQGDVVIHGIFPYLGGDDCSTIYEYGRQLEAAAAWTVRRVNSHGVLSGAVLGLRSYAICTSSSPLATAATTQAYTDSVDRGCVGRLFAGFLTPPLPAPCSALLDELPVMRAPVPAAGGAALEETLAEVAAELGWTTVTVVTDDRGERAGRLVEHVEHLGVCVERWITVTGRQSAAFSELSTLPADSRVVGLLDVSQLSLRQLTGLRWLLALQEPSQLALVPDNSLVTFDTAAEVRELTVALQQPAPAETDTETATKTATETATEMATEMATETATETATKTATETATEMATEMAVETATETATEAATEMAVETATETTTDTKAKTATEVAAETATETTAETAAETATETAPPRATPTDSLVSQWQTPTGPPTPPSPVVRRRCAGCEPFVANRAAVQVVRAVYNLARSVQDALNRPCRPPADCGGVLPHTPPPYTDHGQAFVAALDVTLAAENHTVFLSGGAARPIGWWAGGRHHLTPLGERRRRPADAPACRARFTHPVRWHARVWTTALATLAAVGCVSCLFFFAFYVAISRQPLEHGQGWMALLVVATALQYASTLPFFLREGRVVCALRLQAPALGLVAPLAVFLSRALSLASTYTTRGGLGHVSGWLQTMLCFFIMLVQVGISAERLLSLPTTGGGAHAARCSASRRQHLLPLAYPAFLQTLHLALSPCAALSGRNYWEGPLTAGHAWLATALWAGALALFWLDAPLLDSRSAAAHLCLGVIATASASLLAVHAPRVLLLTRAAAESGGLPRLRRYRAHGVSTAGLVGSGGGAPRSPRCRRAAVEAVRLGQMVGASPQQPPSSPPHPSAAGAGRINLGYVADDALSVRDDDTASAHSRAKYPTTEM